MPPSSSPAGERQASGNPAGTSQAAGAPPASFVKLAMRNMVRKGSRSLLHFGLTALGLTGFLVLLAWLGRPQLPGS